MMRWCSAVFAGAITIRTSGAVIVTEYKFGDATTEARRKRWSEDDKRRQANRPPCFRCGKTMDMLVDRKIIGFVCYDCGT